MIDVLNLDADACREEVLVRMGWRFVHGDAGPCYHHRNGQIFEGTNPRLFPTTMDGADSAIREAGWTWVRWSDQWIAYNVSNEDIEVDQFRNEDSPALDLWRLAVLVWRVKGN